MHPNESALSVAKPLLDVSIVTHGNRPAVIECVTSLFRTARIPMKVYLVANTGENDLTRQLKSDFPSIHVIANEKPLGYAANHNRVMRLGASPYIALLNDDLTIHDTALDELVRFLDEHPQAGIVGPRLLYPDGTLQPSTFGDPTLPKTLFNLLGLSGLLIKSGVGRWLISNVLRPLFPRLLARYWDHSAVVEAEILYGAALVVRRSALESVGPMAEITQAYGEEIDWHTRFRKAGWKLYLVPSASMVHYESKSAGAHGEMLVEARRGLLYYYDQHRTPLKLAIVRAAIAAIHSVRWVLWSLLFSKKRHTHAKIVGEAVRWKSSGKAR